MNLGRVHDSHRTRFHSPILFIPKCLRFETSTFCSCALNTHASTCQLKATIVGRSWGHGTTLASYIRKTGVCNFVSSMSVTPTSQHLPPCSSRQPAAVPASSIDLRSRKHKLYVVLLYILEYRGVYYIEQLCTHTSKADVIPSNNERGDRVNAPSPSSSMNVRALIFQQGAG